VTIVENILEESNRLNIKAAVLDKTAALLYIKEVLSKFNVQKTTGHLAIYHNSESLPIEEFEFAYSEYLKKESGYIFFDQGGLWRDVVIEIEDGSRICEILENCFGVEYFLSNYSKDYLIAVNWYVVEGAGTALDWITDLNTN
jgi:hypothetical protein